MKYILGIDLGTSGTKTVLFNDSGEAAASATAEYPLYQPSNGWAEQNPRDWWQACISTVKTVLKKSGVSPDDIAGIGISGQMHGLVMLDEAGEVIRNSILWCDGRTGEQCAEITGKVGAKRLIEITANPALTGFTAGKILWVRENEPKCFQRCRHILLPKDYIRYMLTGELATEVSDASGMNLLDVPKRRWSSEVLSALEIDERLMPVVYESCEVTGRVNHTGAALTGLAEGTPVVAGAGDNAAAAIGTGVVKKDQAFTTIGTSGVIFAHADQVAIDPKGRVHTFCSSVPGAWTVMSCTLSAGGSLQWFRNQFCHSQQQVAKALGLDPYQIMTQEAERIPPGADRLLFLPYLMGERSPLLDEHARGVFFGLSAIHTKQHMQRAVMEGVVYSLRSCLDVMYEMDIKPETMLVTGGGSRSELWRQMMADVFHCPVKTIGNEQGPALGAAILAGVGVGMYRDIQTACDRVVETSLAEKPDENRSEIYEQYYSLFAGLYQQMKESFHTLAKLP